jgi:hypothetical protein
MLFFDHEPIELWKMHENTQIRHQTNKKNSVLRRAAGKKLPRKATQVMRLRLSVSLMLPFALPLQQTSTEVIVEFGARLHRVCDLARCGSSIIPKN